ncbi:hypothetical protein D3C75_158560 [compost metagenome]
MTTLQVRRGLEANLPTLAVGELGFTTDTRRYFVGSDSGNIELTKKEYVDAQLADTVRISQFPRQSGETDDTARLQRAFNYARTSKKDLINHDASLVFEISSPLYVDSGTQINLGDATIRKTTNTKGEGSNVVRSGTVTDSYVVDAFIILRHEDEQHTMFVKIKGVQFLTSASVRHQYGIYAPRLARSELEDIRTGSGVADYCAFGYQWWLIHKFKNIRLDGGVLTWAIDNDGSNIGQSTSIYAEQVVGTNQDGCFRLYGVSYAHINNPMIDNANGLAYRFTSCRGITVTSASVEYLNSGRFILVEDANVVLNTPNVIMPTGGHASDTYLIQARDSGKLQINEGNFSDYTTSTNTKNFPLMVTNNSSVTSIDTELPTNGNGYRGLTNGGVVIEFNKNGLVFNQLNGSSTIYQNDTRTKVSYGSSLPTDGTWNKGDLFRITAETFGKPIEYVCITSGTPGTWTWTKCATRMGGTSSRTPGLSVADRGVMYLDTTLNAGGLPIWWNGTAWVKHDGNPA